ncbi:hypothetical protein LRY29_00875 [Candidatus Saccharibacteria bacterium]|nr:hypothetical protein [Candidatus Saccharibacteria bacterium]
MEWILDSLWLLASLLFILIILGLVAGFSPTLYAAQVGSGTDSRIGRHSMFGLMAGVLLAAIFLSVLFQFFQLSTLVLFINSTVHALLVNAGFNLLVGMGLIGGGFWYLRHTNIKTEKPPRGTYGRRHTVGARQLWLSSNLHQHQYRHRRLRG